jgi:hypothetical protein
MRQEGIEATKEVQLSAQKVVQENKRLRQLLRNSGIDDKTVDLWISDSSEAVGEKESSRRLQKCGRSSRGQAVRMFR